MTARYIEIVGTPDKTELGMMADVLAHCAQFPDAYKITIKTSPRVSGDAPVFKRPDWLRYNIAVHYRGTATARIVALQRGQLAATEFFANDEVESA